MSPIVEQSQILKAVQQALTAGKDSAKFAQTVELAINLKNVDLSVPKNRIDEDIPLPNGRGKTPKVAMFASGEGAVRARKSVDTVITPEQIEELAKDKPRAKKMAGEHVFFLSEAPLMTTIGKTLGTVLGPRGKMPRPVPPQLDPTQMVSNLRNTVKIRSKDRPTFHAVVGSVDMEAEKIAENVQAVLRRVTGRLEQGEHNLRSVFVKTTMGPAVRIV